MTISSIKRGFLVHDWLVPGDLSGSEETRSWDEITFFTFICCASCWRLGITHVQELHYILYKELI